MDEQAGAHLTSRVDERDDAVQPSELLDAVIDEERLGDGGGIGHAGRLDDDTVEFQALLYLICELVEHNHQILTYGATDASVHHFEDLLLGLELRVLGKQLVINANLFAFVLRVDLFDSSFVVAENLKTFF